MKIIRVMMCSAGLVTALSACDSSGYVPDPVPSRTADTVAEQRAAAMAAAEHLADAMLAWPLTGAGDRAKACARARSEGEQGYAASFVNEHGGRAAEWLPSARWLLRTCESEGL